MCNALHHFLIQIVLSKKKKKKMGRMWNSSFCVGRKGEELGKEELIVPLL